MEYWTLQVTFSEVKNGQAETVTEEFRDMEPTPGADFRAWSKMIREKLYTTGIQIETSPGVAYEFIAPHRIHTAYLIKQPMKLGAHK